jgi:hypothetical protein
MEVHNQPQYPISASAVCVQLAPVGINVSVREGSLEYFFKTVSGSTQAPLALRAAAFKAFQTAGSLSEFKSTASPWTWRSWGKSGLIRAVFGSLDSPPSHREETATLEGRPARKTFRVFEQLDDVVNDIVNFAAANDAPGLEGKSPFNKLLHSFEVHYPIRFPCFSTIG